MVFRMLLLLFSLLYTNYASAGIVLDATTDSLEVVTTSTAAIDYDCNWTDNTTSAFTPGDTAGQITTATTTTVVAAPAASTQRNIQNCTFRNAGTASNTLTIQKDVSAANRTKYSATLGAGESIMLDQAGVFHALNAGGVEKRQASDLSGYSGFSFDYYKIGTASEAVGVRYAYAKDTGMPGAWVPGTPGLNGFWTDCNTASNAANPAGATQLGAHQLVNPATGNYYLTQVGLATSVAHLIELYDIVWYNTGLVVTTTTAQNITMPGSSIPARDVRGTTNGEGWNAAIYVTTATTNAGAVTNTTMSYTDESGNAGATATMASFPATAVAGTFVPFLLVAGDRGVRSVQSVTLGTSYAAGAISLVLYRKLASIPNPIVNVGAIMGPLAYNEAPGVRVYNGSCVWTAHLSSATTATNMAGSINIMER